MNEMGVKMNDNDEKIKNTQKILGEPVFCEFSDTVRKVRTNLFLFSVIAATYVLGELKINEKSSFFGLKFDNFNDQVLRYILIGAIMYLLLHFFWAALDSFFEWRIRLTGSRQAFQTGAKIGSEEQDYPEDPRQSSLYSWWAERSKLLSKINDIFDDETLVQFDRVEIEIRNLERVMCSDRIPASLERFDNWFKLFLKSQNIRWLVIEFLLPVGLAVLALYLLFFRC